jgi:hypothetical protein
VTDLVTAIEDRRAELDRQFEQIKETYDRDRSALERMLEDAKQIGELAPPTDPPKPKTKPKTAYRKPVRTKRRSATTSQTAERKKIILEILGDHHPEMVGSKPLREACGLNSASGVRRLLDQLVEDGKIRKTGDRAATKYGLIVTQLAPADQVDTQILRFLEKTPFDARTVAEIMRHLDVKHSSIVHGALNRLTSDSKVHRVRKDDGEEAFGVPRGSDAGRL